MYCVLTTFPRITRLPLTSLPLLSTPHGSCFPSTTPLRLFIPSEPVTSSSFPSHPPPFPYTGHSPSPLPHFSVFHMVVSPLTTHPYLFPHRSPQAILLPLITPLSLTLTLPFTLLLLLSTSRCSVSPLQHIYVLISPQVAVYCVLTTVPLILLLPLTSPHFSALHLSIFPLYSTFMSSFPLRSPQRHPPFPYTTPSSSHQPYPSPSPRFVVFHVAVSPIQHISLLISPQIAMYCVLISLSLITRSPLPSSLLSIPHGCFPSYSSTSSSFFPSDHPVLP